jgi:hypothetical protein
VALHFKPTVIALRALADAGDGCAGPPKALFRTTMIGPSALRGLLTHGLYSQFAGMINGHSVASGWGDGKEGRHCDHQTTDDCNSDDY